MRYTNKNTQVYREKYPNIQTKIPEYPDQNTRIPRLKYPGIHAENTLIGGQKYLITTIKI
jgi:hypothetical protein